MFARGSHKPIAIISQVSRTNGVSDTFHYENWYNKTDNSRDGRMGVHVLFIDFRKAFDLVDDGILLRKLAEMNVSKYFWLWTRSFLEGEASK